MVETGLVEKFVSFGGIGILALILWLQNKQSTAERQNLTTQFLTYLKEDKVQQGQLLREVMTTIHDNTAAIKTLTTQNTEQHQKNLEALERMFERKEHL
jgi:hypothetical protein